MAKLIKKSKCKFEAGHIVCKNKLVGIPNTVWYQLNKLELIAQQFDYLVMQPKYQAGPSLEGFERKSALTSKRPYVSEPDTPVTDKRVKEAMAFMDEMDSMNDVKEINDAIDEYGVLIDWLASDKFIAGDCYKPIDTPLLGSPLDLVPEDVVAIIKTIVKNPIVMAEV